MLFFPHWTLLLSPSHLHNWVLFLLWLHLFIISGAISLLFSSSILGIYRPGEFIFQCHMFFTFHNVHRILKARILKWFVIPFSSGPCSVRTLHHDPSVLGGPTRHGVISLTRLWSVWSDWLVFCDYGFSVSALWCPLATPTVLLGFLLPWMWSISSQLLQPSATTAPYLWCGVAPLGHHPCQS